MINFIKSLVVALFFAILIRSMIFEPYSIPSGSMKPNFEEGDYIFVTKFAYGFSKHSFPWSPDFFDGKVLDIASPKRGDVVVFRLPTNNNIHYIKRLIGLPGDKIQVKAGHVYLNGTRLDYKSQGFYKDLDQKISNRYDEILPSGVTYSVLDTTPYGAVDDTQEYIVPEKHYFVMGDNRDSSLDSRFLEGPVGYLQKDYVVGRVDLILFSNPTPIWKIWEWPFTFNFDRFIKRVNI
jgi:signal peptidase I